MIFIVIRALIFGLLNALRGGGHVSRGLCVFIMGAAYGALLLAAGNGLLDSGVSGLVAVGGLWLGLSFGWGKGFAAITGRYNPEEKDFWPADKVGDLVYAKTNNAYKAGVAFLTVRAVLFYPLFIALAIWQQNTLLYFSGILVFLMGAVYYVSGRIIEESKAVRLAEFIYLAIIGLSLC